jgi:hypothetical protein
MSAGTVYCIDTSAIIRMWNEAYPIAHFPTLWEHLGQLVAAGRLIAPAEVREELKRIDDGLSKWLTAHKAMFVAIDEAVQIRQKAILAKHKRLVDTRKEHFAADPWVIALALERGADLVTEERPTGSPTKPNIPDVCRDPDFKCQCINVLEVIKREKWVYK